MKITPAISAYETTEINAAFFMLMLPVINDFYSICPPYIGSMRFYRFKREMSNGLICSDIQDINGMMKRELAIMLGAIFIIFCCSALIFPYGRDQGIYACVAEKIVNGGSPYKDAWDFKPPLVFYIFALSEIMFGRGMIAIRIMDIIWQLLAAAALGGVTWQSTRMRELALIVAGAYLAAYSLFDFWNTAQSDGFITLFAACGLLSLFSANSNDKHRWLLFISGGCFAFAFLLKYTAAIFIFIPFLCKPLSIINSQKSFSDSFREYCLKTWPIVLRVGIGFLGVITAALFYLYCKGALPFFLTIQLKQTPGYIGNSFNSRSFLIMVSSGGGRFILTTMILAISFLYCFLRRKLNQRIMMIFIWGLAGIFSVALQGKYFKYHYLPVLAPLALCSLYAASAFLRDGLRSHRARRIVVYSVLGGGLVLLIMFHAKNLQSGWLVATGQVSLERHYRTHSDFEIADFSLSSDFDVRDYLQKRTSPKDKIYIWGFEPLIYYISVRDACSRFIYSVPLHWKWSREQDRREFLSTIRSCLPCYFIVVQNDRMRHVTGHHLDSLTTFLQFDDLRKFVSDNYIYERKIADFHLYRLK